jgi:hypothetical protein
MTGARLRTGVSAVALAVALVLVASVGPFLVAPVAAQSGTNTSATPTPAPRNATVTPAQAPNGTVNGSANTTTPAPGEPTLADRVRLTPVDLGEDYARVETVRADQRYRVTGAFVVFSASERITAARVAQPKADARVLDGGRTVEVTFADDAALPDNRTLYTVDLFLQDGSTKEVDILVQKTDLAVVSSDLTAASGFIERMKEDAEEHGYNSTIAGISDYHEWEKRQADIFDNLLGPELSKAFGAIIAIASSALLVIAIVAVVLLNWRRQKKMHENKLKGLMNGDNLAIRKRREMTLRYEEDNVAADEHRLEDVDLIGGDHVYWSELGVETVKQLATLFAVGRPQVDEQGRIVRQDPDEPDCEYVEDYQGNLVTDADGVYIPAPVMEHRGIADLEDAISRGESLRDTWLEPILRPDMLGSPESALAQGKRALEMMASRYGQPQYQEAYRRLSRLLSDLSEGKQRTYETTDRTALPGAGRTTTYDRDRFGAGGGAAPGGDD